MNSIVTGFRSVRLADVFPPEAVITELDKLPKHFVIEKLVHHLVSNRQVMAEEESTLLEQILVREKLGTTAVGNGIAVPNCLSPLTDRFRGVLGSCQKGIDFNAVDGERVRTVFLVVGPPHRREEHFELLGRIAAIGRDKCLRMQLLGCPTAQAISHFLCELDRSCDAAPSTPNGRRSL